MIRRATALAGPFLALSLAAAGALGPAAGPAAAEGLEDMTAAERASFREEVRAYLLENPEVLMEAIGVLEQRQAEAQSEGEAQVLAERMDEIARDDWSWVGGNPEGDVTVVEFLDYRCGYCKRAFPEVAELIEGDGDIRFVVKEFPILGPQSELGARFAIAVLQQEGDAAYSAVHDALMLQREDITEDGLRALAEDQGLDADAVMGGMDAPEVTEVIARNRALAQDLQINGTPSFVIGDQMLRGYVPVDAMAEIVAAEREG